MTVPDRGRDRLHVSAATIAVPTDERAKRFPFSVPAIRSLERLEFDPVTFLVGENGSGKSTFMEALATAARLPVIGAEALDRDPTLTDQRELARRMKLSWARRTHRGFFLRAEDFFGYAKSLARQAAEMRDEVGRIEAEYRDRSAYAKALALGPIAGTEAAFSAQYEATESASHGQSFLKLFQSRFVPDGLYLLDEPEAPLSPQSQLALLALIADGVARSSQFIIATHSPIVLAFPGAAIYSFDRVPPARVAFEELDHVNLTRSFLNDPGAYLRHLLP